MKKLLAVIIAAVIVGLSPAIAQQFPLTMPANTVYGRLGIGTGPGQAIPLATLGAQILIPSVLSNPGLGKMVPTVPQSTDPTVPWKAYDPFGNEVNCAGTHTQCFNEFVAAANAGGWSWEIKGPGTLQYSVQLYVPPCNGRYEYIDASVNFNPTASFGATDNMLIDSFENCYQIFRGVISQHTGDTGTTVRVVPTNPTQSGSGHVVGTASVMEFFTSILPASGGNGLAYDLTFGSIFGNQSLTLNDINGGVNGLTVVNPGGSNIVFEHNQNNVGYIHGQSGKVAQVGTNSTRQANLKNNTWYVSRVDTDANPSVGWDTWGSYDTYIGLSVVNEVGIATTGLKLESGSVGNIFIGGAITGVTPLVDSGTHNSYLGTKGISGTNSNISSVTLSEAVIATGLPTGSGALGWSGPFMYVGDGTVARQIADISQAQTFTNKTMSGASNTFTNLSTTSLTGTLQAAQEPAHTGDMTNSAGSLTTVVGKVNGVAYGTSPSTNTVPVVTGSNTITYEQVPSAALNPTLPSVCFIVSTAATTCNNGGSAANNGTYTTPSGAKYLRVRQVGGGAGGAGGGSGSPGTGTAGGNTTFSTLTANGGAVQAGAGGSASGGYVNQTGGAGGTGPNIGTQSAGGPGGVSGCGFGSSSFGVVNGVPTAPGGYGNGGAGGGSSGSTNPGAGGSSGGCLQGLIASPSATYSYAVGAAGSAGAAGTSGQNGIGGTGGAIEITAFYQ